MFSSGCTRIHELTEAPLSDSDKIRLQQVEAEMLRGNTVETQFDQKIAAAVRQMAVTLRPEYRQHRLGKYKLGFLEISDIDRQRVTLMHNYVTEKALTFSFLQPVIAENFNIVERFLLKDVLRELHLENFANPRIIDQWLAKRLGRIYDLDFIETGVVTESPDFIDLNLRMIETRRGRIIAVGSVKIEKTLLMQNWMEHWLYEVDDVGVGWPETEMRKP
ncbi:MAG: hypothetical protein B6245_14360 [Desulfobacteraceae bacterium 4572_88]|nr:MAG: hypothetical protein B6245_14360 [Desulfobacteraceae bacterium 4572_88]